MTRRRNTPLRIEMYPSYANIKPRLEIRFFISDDQGGHNKSSDIHAYTCVSRVHYGKRKCQKVLIYCTCFRIEIVRMCSYSESSTIKICHSLKTRRNRKLGGTRVQNMKYSTRNVKENGNNIYKSGYIISGGCTNVEGLKNVFIHTYRFYFCFVSIPRW